MYRISKIIFSYLGWRTIGDNDFPKKCVLIAVPHTSNWDFFYARLYSYIVKIQPKYLAKKELFVPFISYLIKLNGGIPVDRSKKNKLVDFLSKKIIDSKTIILSLSPEGTRKKVDKWKTGFYYIAKKANVPIVSVSMDAKKKEVIFSKPFYPTENIDKDFAHLRKFYRGVVGIVPKNS